MNQPTSVTVLANENVSTFEELLIGQRPLAPGTSKTFLVEDFVLVFSAR